MEAADELIPLRVYRMDFPIINQWRCKIQTDKQVEEAAARLRKGLVPEGRA